MRTKRIVAFLFQAYLILAPINWLPFIPPLYVNLVKYILVVFLCYFTFLTRGIKVQQYYFFSIPYLFLILACAMPAIFMSYENIIFNLLDVIFIFLMFWIIKGSVLSQEELFEIYYKVAIVIGGIGLLSLLSALSGVSMTSPGPWHDPFSSSGFGGYRTGWSNSLFLYVPFLLFYLMQTRDKKKKILCIAALGGIVASQMLSGGRSGFVSSILAFLIFTKFNIKGILILFLALFVTYQLVSVNTLERFFRASDEQIENKAGENKLDKISSGRLEGYQSGLKLFDESPLWGHGFGASTTLTGYSIDIHNTWLKRLVDGGVLFVIPLVLLFYNFYKSAIKNIKLKGLNRNYLVLFRTLFFLSLFISMGEPNYLIGSFQGEAFFWALTGSFLK